VTLNGGDVNEHSHARDANGAIIDGGVRDEMELAVYSNAQYVYTGTDRTVTSRVQRHWPDT